jgi:hypothetical protein
MQEISDRRDGEGHVSRRRAPTDMVVVLTLTAMLGVIGFLVAGSVARSCRSAT